MTTRRLQEPGCTLHPVYLPLCLWLQTILSQLLSPEPSYLSMSPTKIQTVCYPQPLNAVPGLECPMGKPLHVHLEEGNDKGISCCLHQLLK